MHVSQPATVRKAFKEVFSHCHCQACAIFSLWRG